LGDQSQFLDLNGVGEPHTQGIDVIDDAVSVVGRQHQQRRRRLLHRSEADSGARGCWRDEACKTAASRA
jgi:hypothetical protein